MLICVPSASNEPHLVNAAKKGPFTVNSYLYDLTSSHTILSHCFLEWRFCTSDQRQLWLMYITEFWEMITERLEHAIVCMSTLFHVHIVNVSHLSCIWDTFLTHFWQSCGNHSHDFPELYILGCTLDPVCSMSCTVKTLHGICFWQLSIMVEITGLGEDVIDQLLMLLL